MSCVLRAGPGPGKLTGLSSKSKKVTIDSDWESVLLAEVQHHKVLQIKRTVKPTTEGASHPTSAI